jgi:hypothetical protein
MRFRPPSLTYANVMSTLAVFLVLGGGAYAAVSLPKNSVGAKQIKRGAVNSSKVKDRSLRLSDFKPSQIPKGDAGPRGPQGPQGAAGPQGEAGTARAFAHLLVTASSVTVDAQRSKGIAQANVSKGFAGVACIKGLPFTPLNAVASGDAAQNPAVVVSTALAPDTLVLTACGGDAQVAVATQEYDGTSSNVDHDVYVLLN